MTVSELIEVLRKMPQDAVISVLDYAELEYRPADRVTHMWDNTVEIATFVEDKMEGN